MKETLAGRSSWSSYLLSLGLAGMVEAAGQAEETVSGEGCKVVVVASVPKSALRERPKLPHVPC